MPILVQSAHQIYLTQAFAFVDVPCRSLGERNFEVRLKPTSVFEILRQVNLHIIFLKFVTA
jgi:hypothetical protein